MSDKIRIIVADDHPLFREGVVKTLAREADIDVIAEASSGEEAVEQAVDLLPDLAILDLTMPGIGGITATIQMSERCPATTVLVLTVSEDSDDLLQALKAGARGYVLKGVSGRELVQAVRSVIAGEVYITPALAAGILSEMTRNDPADPFKNLTDREHEILQLVAGGLTNREIGAQLYIAEKTVKHYMTNVLQKLQVRSRVEAALLAQRRDFESRD